MILACNDRIKQCGLLTRLLDLVYAARPLTRVKRDECRFANSCYVLPLELAQRRFRRATKMSLTTFPRFNLATSLPPLSYSPSSPRLEVLRSELRRLYSRNQICKPRLTFRSCCRVLFWPERLGGTRRAIESD